MTANEPISRKRENRWAWVWFAYTGFLFITPILEPSRYLWLGTLAVFFVFVGVMWGYIRAVDEGHPARFWMIAATFALGLITFPWNQGGSTFFVYSAAFLPFTFVSLRRVFSIFFAEVLLVLIEGAIFHGVPGFFHVSWPNTFIAIFLMTVIGGGNVFFAQQRRADCKLRAALDENLALAAVAERERIARDLHDVLGHTLSVVALKAELAGRLIHRQDPSDHARAASEIADVERITRTALAEVREAIGGYRTRGLGAEIEAARLTLDAAGVKLILDSAATNAANLSVPEEIALSLALREAVTNIVRHSRATTCCLRFITEDNQRRLVIEDNGEHAISREGNGLRGMRERIESLGGHLFLERDHGTRLLIELPLREPAAS
ncbi:MAG TPA: sensor histidine kinase [Acidobacteriaceae bacterium]|jgi:two-component system sensor histidine kinase DesK|nr:sensor histidine kinase [Acidobacteriaceae bacterium]